MDGSTDGRGVGGWVGGPVLHLKARHSGPISDLPVGLDVGMLYLPFPLQGDVRLFSTVHFRTPEEVFSSHANMCRNQGPWEGQPACAPQFC